MTFSEIVLLLGGWSVVLVAGIGYVFNRVADRLSIKWKKSADESIAKLQADLSKNNNILNSLISMQSSNHALIQARRLKATEILWESLIDFNDKIPMLLRGFLTTLSVEDYEKYWDGSEDENQPIMRDVLLTLVDKNPLDPMKGILTKFKVEIERPFMGEKLWELYFVYTVFVEGVVREFFFGLEDRFFVHWTNDKEIVNFLRRNVSEKEIEYIFSDRSFSFKTATTLLETKIIEEINRILIGDAFS